ncbi:hypothetical protein POSPLADRAFT_1033535 [Postia placenta MAD-698-R-SB12]|uniref:Uncharacterized protein n=1 Tax=Postia placenta MAD-698-R-SB12 TaxID=670580 RepID=A0A1X6N2Q6_9APHY|nr:hypothetical protein POSPLADRAFT_1033535 [Postia placenta MAD-698-R-SB12]OSX62905.1 hypothetical protein POSPLADRAFT_1033535 [Postia placenta MAD-698-R-SB12]
MASASVCTLLYVNNVKQGTQRIPVHICVTVPPRSAKLRERSRLTSRGAGEKPDKKHSSPGRNARAKSQRRQRRAQQRRAQQRRAQQRRAQQRRGLRWDKSPRGKGRNAHVWSVAWPGTPSELLSKHGAMIRPVVKRGSQLSLIRGRRRNIDRMRYKRRTDVLRDGVAEEMSIAAERAAACADGCLRVKYLLSAVWIPEPHTQLV